MDWNLIKSIVIPEGNVKKITANGSTLWEKASGVLYELIEPIDADSFPVLHNFKLITLDGSENWRSVSTGYYTSNLSSYFAGVSRTGLMAFSEHWPFDAVTTGGGDLTAEHWMFNGTSSNPVNGNLTFKNSYTSEGLSAWQSYLAENNEKILIPLNSSMADDSEWKPAKRISDGATGYWDGGNGFIAIYGGIPYYGTNLVTDAVIASAYNNAWISSEYKWVTASNSTSFVFPVIDGAYYHAVWDSIDSDVVGTIFRYGFTDNNTPGSSNTLTAPRARTTPQDAAEVILQASGDFMVVQVAGGTFPGNAGHLSVREMVGYVEEAPVLMMMGNPNPNPEPIPEEDEELTAEAEPEEQPKLVCPYCGKEYQLEFYYNKHVAAHEAETEGGES